MSSTESRSNWDGVERRKRGNERDALDPAQAEETKEGVSNRIATAFDSGNFDNLTISADAALMPELLTSDFARRLRATRTGDVPHGALLTFHEAGVDGGEYADTYIPDETGHAYPPVSDPFEETPKPIPDGEIAYATIRKLPHAVGEVMPPDDDLYESLDPGHGGKGFGFGNTERGLIQTRSVAMSIHENGKWSEVSVLPYSEVGFSPNMQAIHYGGGLFEGVTAEWGEDGQCYIFGIRDHFNRTNRGAIAHGIEPIPWEIFEEAIIKAVQQNAKYIPKNGRLYIRPHVADIGKQMRVGNSLTKGFFVEVTPIGSVESYFGAVEYDKAGNVKGKGLVLPTNKVRSAKGLGGSTKGIENYGLTPAVIRASSRLNIGTDDDPRKPVGVLYLDRATKCMPEDERLDAEIRETNASNIIFFEDLGGGRYRLVTPSLEDGDILPGNTRRLILEKAQKRGWEVEERHITLREIVEGKFIAAGNCGTAAVFSPVDWLHFAEFNQDDEKGQIEATLIGGKMDIRSQDAINADPTPEPISLLTADVLAVKSAKNPADTAKYLTEVPGIRLAA